MKKVIKLVAVTLVICLLFISINVYAKQPVELTGTVFTEDDHKDVIDDISATNLPQKMLESKKDVDRLENNRKALEIINSPKVKYYDETKTMYASNTIIVRSEPNEEGHNAVGQIKAGDPVQLNGSVEKTNWYAITYNGELAFVKCENLSDDRWAFTYNNNWDGEILNKSAGVVFGPNGYESYYNLPMGGIISIMRSMGFDEENYPYWVRDDGAKMLGGYVMVAANLSTYPRGTTSVCSLGPCIICDTGGFIHSTNRTFDVATAW